MSIKIMVIWYKDKQKENELCRHFVFRKIHVAAKQCETRLQIAKPRSDKTRLTKFHFEALQGQHGAHGNAVFT